jgi:hypothetical protein
MKKENRYSHCEERSNLIDSESSGFFNNRISRWSHSLCASFLGWRKSSNNGTIGAI